MRRYFITERHSFRLMFIARPISKRVLRSRSKDESRQRWQLIRAEQQRGKRLLKREIADGQRCAIGSVHKLSPSAQSCGAALAGRNLEIGGQGEFSGAWRRDK